MPLWGDGSSFTAWLDWSKATWAAWRGTNQGFDQSPLGSTNLDTPMSIPAWVATGTAALAESADSLASAVETSVKLYLRNTQNNGVGSTYYDLVATAGAAADTAVVNTTVSGTEIQWTKTAGGAVAQWLSGRAPEGGFTLSGVDVSIWASESTPLANSGGRIRVFKRAADATETEIGGGPFDSGLEFTTSDAEYAWTGNVDDTAFAENDRVLLKVYITNVGVMAVGTCTLTFNAADAALGDSFLNVLPRVAFKTEDVISPHTPARLSRLALVGIGAKRLAAFVAKQPDLGERTSAAALLEQPDALTAAATVAVAASASIAESADALTAAATTLVTASSAAAERGDSLSSSGVAGVGANASITEQPDTLLAQTAVAIAVSAALLEMGDALSASGSVEALVGPHNPGRIGRLAQFGAGSKDYVGFVAKAPAGPQDATGAALITEGPDTLASAVAVAINAAANAAEAADTLTAAASSALSGASAITERPDTLAASGSVSVTATLSTAERADSLLAASAVAISATAALAEAADALGAAATAFSEGSHTPGRIGRLAQFGVGTRDYAGFVGKASDAQAERFANASITEGADTLAALGSSTSDHTPGHITRLGQFAVGLTKQATFAPKVGSRDANAALIEASDALTAAAQVAIAVTAALVERGDLLNAATAVAIVCNASLVERGDTLAADGGSATFVIANPVEAPDRVASTATVLVTGTFNVLENADRLSAVGFGQVTASAAILEAADIVASSTAVSVTGAAAAREASDTLDSFVIAASRIGTANIRERDDTLVSRVRRGRPAKVRGRDVKRHNVTGSSSRRNTITGGDGL